MQILSDLQRQRETILHSRDTLQTVDTHISRSRQILQTMSRRIVQNKVGAGGTWHAWGCGQFAGWLAAAGCFVL